MAGFGQGEKQLYKYITLTILIIICASSAVGQTLIGKTVRLNDGGDTAYSTLTETDIKQKANVTNYSSGETSDTLVWTGSGTNFVLRGGAGTGIDADKLDGQHGAYYRAVTNLDFNNILLPDSTGSVGAIYFNAARAMHNYGDSYNFFAGTNAGNFTMTDGATSATAFGVNALCELTSGTRNTAMGAGALAANTTGKLNNAFGQRALRSNVSGIENTAIAESALAHNTTGSNNVAVGGGALFMNNGDGNTAVGCSALLGNEYDNNVWNHPNDVISTGDHNTALGAGAGQGNSAGSNNLYLGAAAFWQNDGDGNIGIGRLAGAYETTSSNTLYINNQDRGDLAGDKAKSLVWGTFADEPADQRFRINAQATVNGDLIVTGTLTAAGGIEKPKENVITVAKSGGDYTTIQAAVDAATTGTTVLVFPGEYAEEVSINKPISLIGTDKTNCVIKKSVVGNGYAGDHLVTVESGIASGYVEIRGLTMWNTYNSYSSTALKVVSPARIRDCNIIGNEADALILGNTSGIYVDDCYISGFHDTLSITAITQSPPEYYINNCRIVATRSDSMDSAPIWVGNDNLTAHISNCDLITYANNGCGILISNDSGKTIKLYLTNNRIREDDNDARQLFYYGSGTGTTAYIANCQYSAIGNANVTVNYLASSAVNALGGSTFAGTTTVNGLSAGSIVATNINLNATEPDIPLQITHLVGADEEYHLRFNGGLEFSLNSGDWDTNLYWGGANILKTDDAFDANSLKIGGTEVITSARGVNASADISTSGSLRVSGSATINGDIISAQDADEGQTKSNIKLSWYDNPDGWWFKIDPVYGLFWGADTTETYDTNLYRYNDNILKTDDAFDANSLKIGGTEVITSARGVNASADISTSGSLRVSGSATINGDIISATGQLRGAYMGIGTLLGGTLFGDGEAFENFTFKGYSDNGCVWNSGDDGYLPMWTFGGDTTLYRGAANILKTDDAFDANSLKISGTEVITSARGVNASADISTSGSLRVTGAASIGAAKFTVDANGNITKVNNVTTSFPAANGAGFMKNNGSGTLSWAALADADIPNDITINTATNATNSTNASNATTATASLSVKLDSTPDNLTVSGKTASGTVGENVTFGQMLYLKSDGKYWKADASSTATMTIVAMAAQAISGDGSGSILLEGYARNDSWDALTIGAAIWGSETAGAYSQIRPITADAVIQNVGYAAGAKTIYFEPNSTFIVAEE